MGASEDGTEDLVRSIVPRAGAEDHLDDSTLRKAVGCWPRRPARAGRRAWGCRLGALHPRDEVLHEDGLDAVRTAMEDRAKDERVDGLLFSYLHFSTARTT